MLQVGLRQGHIQCHTKSGTWRTRLRIPHSSSWIAPLLRLPQSEEASLANPQAPLPAPYPGWPDSPRPSFPAAAWTQLMAELLSGCLWLQVWLHRRALSGLRAERKSTSDLKLTVGAKGNGETGHPGPSGDWRLRPHWDLQASQTPQCQQTAAE